MLETKYYIQNGKYKKASRHFDRSQIVFSGSAFLSLFLSKNLKMNEETTKQSADSSVLILTIDFQEFFSDLFPWEPRDLAMSHSDRDRSGKRVPLSSSNWNFTWLS